MSEIFMRHMHTVDFIVAGCLLAVHACLAAQPLVTNVIAQQRVPPDMKVDIH